mgnify:CR=1 FL=1|tara:strand:+ start:257 stop:718 length:462 start_codon:yes stop_codon:yes gene_type:complete
MSKIISLNKKQILEHQQNKPPYLMIDQALEIIPGKSAKGFKQLEDDEWFFKVHWENDPNMPGMLQVEALVQMSALAILTMPDNKGKVMYLTSANNLKFSKKIIPGMRLDIETNIKSFKRGIAICDGLGLINNEIACKANFNLILPSELEKYKI